MPLAATTVMGTSVTKAFEAIAKTKKQTWKAMERAMEQVKSSASSLGVMSSLMGIFGIVTKLASVPVKELIADLAGTDGFIETLQALGTAGGDVLADTLNPLLKVFTQMGGEEGGIIPLIASLIKLSNIMSKISLLPINAFMGLLSGALSKLGIELGTLPDSIDKVVDTIDDLGDNIFEFYKEFGEHPVEPDISGPAQAFFDQFPNLNPYLEAVATTADIEETRIAEERFWAERGIIQDPTAEQIAAERFWATSGRSFQFGGIIPQTGPYFLHAREEVIPSNKRGRGRGEISIHIDLRNAVVDNVDRLSQKIAEQVLIQIG